ncbi:MAG: 1-phosphofructokinase family hexose kinase [Oceanidesulfovibrio sp.]
MNDLQSIVTLTMNPAIDKSADVEHVTSEDKLRCSRPVFHPGGGGINVTRALARLGGDSTAVYQKGGPIGDLLTMLLDKENIRGRPFETENWTRENFVAYETSTGEQYRFGMPGPELAEKEWQDVIEMFRRSDNISILVASGSLPPGAPGDFYARLARVARDKGVRFVLDTSGAALELGLEEGAFLVKPNLRELAALTGHENVEEHVDEAAAGLVQAGKAEVVAVSLGAAGIVLATAEGTLRIPAPTVKVRSKVGAGDSTVAGMVLGFHQGMEPREAAQLGTAAGAAAVMTPGTELCRKEDAFRLFEKLKQNMAQ